jgi:hypothetical protein
MTQRAAGIWWLHPAFVFAAAGVVISVAAYRISESTYRTYWRTPKFFDEQALRITFFCVIVFVFGSLAGTRLVSSAFRAVRAQPQDKLPWGLISLLFRISFYLCLLGYALWVALAIGRGITMSVLWDVLNGEKGAMYEARYVYLPTVGGVTTLTQFGSAAMILAAIVGFGRGWKGVWPKCAIIISLALLRALANSERFAIIELAVPFLVASLGLLLVGSTSIRLRWRRLVNFAPIIGIVALFVLFTGFEYFRSWSNYYAGRDLSLWEFGAMRLLGYYVTSFNNGAYLLQRLEPLGGPYFTLHFLWGFPLSGPLMKLLFPNPLLDSNEKWFYFPFLEAEANVEFNNADGVLYPLMDYGAAGGLLYWFVIGVILGAVYQLFRNKKPLGLFLYPMLFLGLIEVPLGLYWAEGRAFPALCILFGAAALIRLMQNQYSWLIKPVSKRELTAPSS